MSDRDAIPPDVFEAAVRVSGAALYWRSSLRQIMRSAGVSENAATRYEQLSKYQAFRTAWDELENSGPRGRVVQYNLIRALANLDRPDPRADQDEGRHAIEELRRLAKRSALLLDPEEHAIEVRRASFAAAQAERELRSRRVGEIRERFKQLHTEPNAQRRGYAFEKVLADLFRVYELEFYGSYKTETDQVDGALQFDSFTYLLEARWRRRPAVDADLMALAAKAARRIDATRGLFISMAGYRQEVVELHRMSRDSRLVLMDGEDLTWILDQRVELPDALRLKIRAASVEGEPYVRLAAAT